MSVAGLDPSGTAFVADFDDDGLLTATHSLNGTALDSFISKANFAPLNPPLMVDECRSGMALTGALAIYLAYPPLTHPDFQL